MGMGKPKDSHRLFRAMVCTELQQHPEKYTKYGYSEQFLLQSVETMSKDGTFAGDLELHVFADLMRCKVTLHQFNEEPKIYGPDSAEREFSIGYCCHSHYDLLLDEDIFYDGTVISLNDAEEVSTVQTQEAAPQVALEQVVQAAVDPLTSENDARIQAKNNLTLTDLIQHQLSSRTNTVTWLKELDLFYTQRSCDKCGQHMKLRNPSTEHPDGEFYCATCKYRTTVRKDNIFSDLKGDLPKIVQLFIRLFKGDSISKIIEDTGASIRSLTRYHEMYLIMASLLLERHTSKIGGEGRVVEIDECLLHKRKYQVGHLKEDGWILGGVERPRNANEKPRIFVVTVPDRTQATLENCIQQWVEPGTIIITDCFRSYNHLESLGYHHFTVNHSQNFKDPSTAAHTQRIEGLWHWIKRQALPATGAKLEDLDFYLSAYLYRRAIDGDIVQFLRDVGTIPKQHISHIIEERAKLSKEYAELRANEAQERQNNLPPQPVPPPEPAPTSRHTEPAAIVRNTVFTSPRKRQHTFPFPPLDSAPANENVHPTLQRTLVPESSEQQTQNPFQLVVDMHAFHNSRKSRSEIKMKKAREESRRRGRARSRGRRQRKRRIELSQPQEDNSSEGSITISDEDDYTGLRKRKRSASFSPPQSPQL